MKIFKILKNQRAVAAIEFAIILPLMLTIFLGMMAVSNYVMVTRKLEMATNDIAFLYSRNNAGLYDEFNDPNNKLFGYYLKTHYAMSTLATLIMYPHPAAIINSANGYNAWPRFAGNLSFFGLPRNDDFSQSPMARHVWSTDLGDIKGITYAGDKAHSPYTQQSFQVTNTNNMNILKISDNNSSQSRELARFQYPGESYIVYTMGYTTSMSDSKVLMLNLPVFRRVNNILPAGINYIQRTAVYPVRSYNADFNGDGIIELAERNNNMHLCAQCKLSSCAGPAKSYNSGNRNNSGSDPTLTCGATNSYMTTASPAWRMRCKRDTNSMSDGEYLSGGCSF